MAHGMNTAALASGIEPEMNRPHLEGEDLASIKRTCATLEIVGLPEEKQEEALEAIRARKYESKPIKAYGRQCGARERGGSDQMLKKKGDDVGPLAKMMYQRFPFLTWMKNITASGLKSDLIAGLTVGVMVIPQSMSYAAIAGLGYKYGMYSACVPTLIYAFCGQSRQLAVGPVAMVSLLVEAGLRGQLTKEDCPEWYAQGGEGAILSQADLCPVAYAGLASLTALVVGVMQVVGSIMQLGFLVSFLGHPVTSGFTSGAAIIIGLSQFKYVLGYEIPKSQFVHETIINIVQGLGKLNFMSLLLGAIWFAYLYGMKWAATKIKQKAAKLKAEGDKVGAKRLETLSIVGALGPLISCACGIFLLWGLPVLREDFHVKYVADIPAGFAPPSLDFLKLSYLSSVLPTALSSCLIGYMESIAIGKNLASKHNYEIDAGQEMFALGFSNLVGAFFSCYPVTGSFSRSAVANSTGAVSQLAGLITSVMMFITLMLLTPYFYYLPKYALAVIVISSVMQLVQIEEALKLRRIKRHDCFLWVVAFIGTLFLGVLIGIAVAVILSLAIVIYESVRPQLTILWRIPGTHPAIYRNFKQDDNGLFVPNVFICRIGSSMYFANSHYVKDMLLNYVSDLAEANPTEYVVLEMTPVISIDSTACEIIKDIVNDFRGRGIETAFAMVGNRVEKTLGKAKLKKYIGEEWFFPTVHEAVQFCLKHQHAKRRRFEREQKREDDQEQTLDIDDIDVRAGNEVGFSNEWDGDNGITTVFMSLGCDIPMSEITSIFKKNKVKVIRCQVEPLDYGAKHTYNLKSIKTGNQLTEFEIDRIRDELQALIEKYKKAPTSPMARALSRLISEDGDGSSRNLTSLELALALQQENNAKMSNQMQIQAERIDALMGTMGVSQKGGHGCGKCVVS